MEKYKISIIIPIYNAEKYLKDSVESIVNQTFNFKEIQLILINDGSSDKSGDIANEYAQKYNNIEVIHLEKNHLVAGYPRNIGLELVKGKYLMFLDADDCYDKNTCRVMYETITKNNSDIVTGNYKYMQENGKVWEKEIINRELYKTTELNKIDETFFYLYCPSVCLKIFKTEIIKNNDIQFLEGISGEDAYFSSKALLKSKKIYYIDDIIYYYRRRNKGKISTSWKRDRAYFEGINKSFKAISNIYQELDKVGYYKFYYARNLTSLIYKFIDSKMITNEERIELLENMHWFFNQSKEMKIEFEQKTVNILLNNIIKRKYENVTEICEIVSEIRENMNDKQKEAMSKPTKFLK